MPRIEVPGFVNGSNTLRARQVNAERLVNGIVESTAPGVAKAPKYLRRIPGVRPFATVPGGVNSVRGLFQQDGRAFVVAGTQFREFFADGSFGPSVTVVEDNTPATFACVRVIEPTPLNQLLVLSGGSGIVYDLLTDTEAAITAPSLVLPYSMCVFIDGYGVIVKANSPQFNFSDVQDFTTFPTLNIAQRSEADDNISFIVRSHRELVMIGTLTGEVWQDDGTGPFAPIQGVFIEQGSAAPYAGAGVDNTVAWIGANIQGVGQVFRLNGYTPERISSPAVELALSRSNYLDQTIAWTMQLESHTFYGLYVPDLPTTWVYDFAEKTWSEWSRWDTTHAVDIPWFARCHCVAFGKHLIGDRSSGTIYETSLDLFDNELVSA